MGTREVLKIGMTAGVVSAMIPSVPTIVRFWANAEEWNKILDLKFFKIKQGDFLLLWLAITIIIIIMILLFV